MDQARRKAARERERLRQQERVSECRSRAANLLRFSERLSPWEMQFVWDMRVETEPTTKQIAKLKQIHHDRVTNYDEATAEFKAMFA